MDILAKIVAMKRERVDRALCKIPKSEMKLRARDIGPTRDFAGAITRGAGAIRLIAEIKKASPSQGVIAENFDLFKIASLYEEKPAHAISILTEEDFFLGHLTYLKRVKDITTKPLLRKDFIFDDYQIYESRANHADAILLIAAILDKTQGAEYYRLAKELGLGVLFEIHNEEELEKALFADADIIGINNRDLKTMAIDLNTTVRLKKQIPAGKIVVSESGIRSRDDVKMLSENGIDAMLVGTSLMSAMIGIDDLLRP
jgi:indole-3-glycerol phosphate synthase